MAASASLAILWASPAALAHAGNPKMLSDVRSIKPATPGLSIEVLNRDDRFELNNRSGKDVVIYGYTDDQLARVLRDGTVEVNKNAPSYYLNQDRYAASSVPAFASAKAPPRWSVIDGTGRYQWHDHRMHYMGTGVPSQVKDVKKRQKIFDYAIPISVGGAKGTIPGTLFWAPPSQSGPGAVAWIALGIFVLVSVLLTIGVRRRRREHDDRGDRPDPAIVGEAW